MARLLRVDGMLSRTESIEGFHLKLTRTEKELYEEFLKAEEAEILAETQQYFAEAKQKAGGSMTRASGQESKAQSMPGSQTLVPISMRIENWCDGQTKQSCTV
jgi:hypothetical protein